jgi:hypothetical protein
MGSPVSVVLAELSMQRVEEEILEAPPCEVLFWYRYVDDIITAVPKADTDRFLQHLNQCNENIQFTYETEVNNSLPFLDLNINKKGNGSLTFSVYRKASNTNQYLNFRSNHCEAQRRTVVKNLYRRAELICDADNLQEEVELIRKTLQNNDYPNKFIRPANYLNKNGRRPEPNLENDRRKQYVAVPYVKGCSERIQRILKPFNIHVCHKSKNTLRAKLCHLKDRRPVIQRNKAVY